MFRARLPDMKQIIGGSRFGRWHATRTIAGRSWLARHLAPPRGPDTARDQRGLNISADAWVTSLHTSRCCTPVVWRKQQQQEQQRPRGLACCAASSAKGAGAAGKKRLVFLGTPEVAALVLDGLLSAAEAPGSTFEVAAVVSQPGRPKGRGAKRVPQPSPVEALALERGVDQDRILCPVKANEDPFLEALRGLGPDLCVTAAYGNVLPQRFLDIPVHGTLNIHPSLLPLYRGAAPVQRALQDGVPETGVSVAFTVRAMDAGPVLAQEVSAVGADEAAPELLERLFRRGTQLLLEALPDVWAGHAQQAARPQDEAAATHAAKLSKEEAMLDFCQPASVLHNKVRAFAAWPGTRARFVMRQQGGEDEGDGGGSGGGSIGKEELVELKVIRTQLDQDPGVWQGDDATYVPALGSDALLVRCGDGAVLKILQVQVPGKRAVAARDFINGLKAQRQKLYWQQSRNGQ